MTTRGTKELQVGDKAPDFTLPDDSGREVSLSGLKGRPVVLYFYPKDATPGCTKEACDFTALLPRFKTAGAAVLGVSRDGVESHRKFKEKHGLAFPLLSDADGTVTEAYGVWVEKSLYGRKFMGIERSTFVVDARGMLRAIARKVKVDGHAEAMLQAVKAQ